MKFKGEMGPFPRVEMVGGKLKKKKKKRTGEFLSLSA